MQKLIVNADDFGLCKEVNEGIAEGADKGIITSASILGNFTGNLPEAKIGVGAHLNLTYGNSLADGKPFPSNILTRATLIKTNALFIEKEFRKQIENLVSLGYKLDHLNTHKHIHAIYPVSRIVYELAREFKIKYVRYPREEFKFKLKNLFPYSIVKLNISNFPDDLKCADNFFGILDTGNPKLGNYFDYLNFENSAEIMCHPAKGLSGISDKLKHYRGEELKILTDKRLIEEIKERGIKLIRCRDLW